MRILICDDHVMFAEAMASLLVAHGHDASTCAEPAAAAARVAEGGIDVCLMDLSFDNGANGIDGVRAIKAVDPRAVVVMLSGSSEDEAICAAQQAGAKGFLFKVASAADVVPSLLDALEADGFFVQGRARPAPSRPPEPRRDWATQRLDSLTVREREVLERMINGETAPYIAEHLGVSYATARSHVQRVLTKLGAHSRLEAVAFAASLGLVPETVTAGAAGSR